MIKSDKEELHAPALSTECDEFTNSDEPLRGGNYSCIGYQNLKSPQSEAEKWNMPFTDPEFAYDSIS